MLQDHNSPSQSEDISVVDVKRFVLYFTIKEQFCQRYKKDCIVFHDQGTFQEDISFLFLFYLFS